MANPMKIRARAEANGVVDVRALMAHDMETGQRKDSNGRIIPAHFIQTVTVTCQGRPVLNAQWGPAVSRNPFLNFRFRGNKGDKVLITWVDNRGDTRTDETTVG